MLIIYPDFAKTHANPDTDGNSIKPQGRYVSGVSGSTIGIVIQGTQINEIHSNKIDFNALYVY